MFHSLAAVKHGCGDTSGGSIQDAGDGQHDAHHPSGSEHLDQPHAEHEPGRAGPLGEALKLSSDMDDLSQQPGCLQSEGHCGGAWRQVE